MYYIQDVVISCVLAGGHFVGGVLQAFYGNEWNNDDYTDDRVEKIYRSMIASAVSEHCIRVVIKHYFN